MREPALAVSKNIVFIDRRGVIWQPAPAYTERDTTAPGWLLLKSETDEEDTFSAVLDIYGFEGPEGNYLYAKVQHA